MAKRISKVVTKTGDKGDTGLGDKSRVAKDSARVQVLGDVDELNSHIGLVLANYKEVDDINATLSQVQNDLFDLGGELAIPGTELVKNEQVDNLEKELNVLNADLPELPEFILPGGSVAGAQCHVARTVCRRAERKMVSLAKQEKINPQGLKYLNRLGDLLFVIARTINDRAGAPEKFWQR